MVPVSAVGNGGWSVHTLRNEQVICGLAKGLAAIKRPLPPCLFLTSAIIIVWILLVGAVELCPRPCSCKHTQSMHPTLTLPCPSQPSWPPIVACAPLSDLCCPLLEKGLGSRLERKGDCSQLFTGWNHRLDSDRLHS